MKRYYISFLLLVTCVAALAAPKGEAAQVRQLIERVNNYWQQQNKPTHWAFWDYAAYHTGNIEAYRLTGNRQWLSYSEQWAEHNHWRGAGEKDPQKWQYKTYGEDQQHVLFGDWQICFQTYIDLYNELPVDYKVSRAREVMGYEMKSRQNDYWWWADALYMVMPVMTKMYRLTGDEGYLNKLYDNLKYSDGIMLDEETGLYFRDGKYVYPKHKSANGKKDFWARGDGWVLAGLAKVLQDMPQTYKHYQFFRDKYVKMAHSVASLQQPGGYWTRSMMDPDHAPGPETSGTAFFTYGLCWGINHGLLSRDEYLPVVQRAWQYLSKKALQKSGKVGFVQPIGEKAIPGQVVNQNSEAPFGTGAWLLAACEYTRLLELQDPGSATSQERAYWVEQLRRMAQPVLENMARGELKKNMRLEVSPNWDGRNKGVAYMECFGRLMAGIAPWLALPDDQTEEGQLRRQMRQWALDAFKNAVDPDNPDYLLWRGHGQALVDAAYVAEALLRGWDALWRPLDIVTKQRYMTEFAQLRRVDPPYTNWVLFSSTIESLIFKATKQEPALKDYAQGDEYRINSACRKVEEWYVGDGWYADGPVFAFDYYSSYVFHPMYLETLWTCHEAGLNTRLDYRKYYDRELRRAQKFALVLERFISPEGTFPVIGRSTPYRLAAMTPLSLLCWYDQLPEGVSRGQARAALTATLHRMMDQQDNYRDGYLTIGFCGQQPATADWYTNNGSLYITSMAFIPLGLPATHPFWTDAPQPWTQVKAWGGQPFPKDHRWADQIQTRDKW
ncbi:MAG: DUF2264 domain-containing protein [Prevotella sp.]|nr:DUF2264 domain-containing protein [Prevotella sp.]